MTSRFAPVAPLAIHRRLAEAGAIGEYHLLLAHQVLENPDAHRRFYREQLGWMLGKQRGEEVSLRDKARRKPYIIMDNSLIELGFPLPLKDVIEAAEIVRANVIVLPDVLGDRIQTLNLAAQSVEEIHELRASSPYARKVKMLGVAQGKTFNDFFSCARDMIQTLGVEAISIPRHAVAKIGSRVKLVEEVRKYGKPLHLLGFSDNLLDDFTALSTMGVMGIDSALPIWYGLQGFELPTNPPIKADFGKRPKDYESQTEINSKVIINIRRVERWASIAKDARTRR